MGTETAIAWTRSTFNPWWGCTKISEACRDCYAEKWALRTGHKTWGPMAPRRFFDEPHWNEPRKWNAKALMEKQLAQQQGKPPPAPWTVFCASMADVFEELPEQHPAAERMAADRTKLWRLIDETPHLTWLLLTKRPENITRCFPWAQANDGTPLRAPLPNVWLGTTVENQATADVRVPLLLRIGAVVRFISCEPMLERVDFAYSPRNRHGLFWKVCPTCDGSMSVPCEGGGKSCPTCYPPARGVGAQGFVNAGIDWLICGGESHQSPAKARPFDVEWAQDLREQCREAGVAFFMKQLGDNPVRGGKPLKKPAAKAGADIAEFPVDLQRREYPRARAA